MILQCVQLLLETVAGLKKRFIAMTNGFEFTRMLLELLIVAEIFAFTGLNAAVELVRSSALRLFLADKLALRVK